ncbi:MAG: hypothetical protein WD468_00235 [Pirellulales bacterium]
MRVERALVGLFCITAMAVLGCGGQLAYNLPPASRLMEPGPGVGGPGPGVIPPAGSPYGMYGGAVGRFGDGAGAYMGGGYGGGPCAANQPGPMPGGPGGSPMMANRQPNFNNSGVEQAGYYSGCDSPVGCGDSCAAGSCPIGGGCANCGCMGGGCNGPCCGGPNACACGGAGCGLCGGGGALGGLLHGHGHGHAYGPGDFEASADGAMMGPATSQVAFLGEEGVQIGWDVNGSGYFDSTPLVIPGRQDFYQGAIYRLKLSNIPGRAGVELYPTLEIAPVTPRTDAYLAHAPIPVQFTEEDFDQVLSGNFVTKVIYLPDPEFQELALAGVETLVSTRLDPGVDPIAEADRRGSILAILRMGNKDLERGSGMSYESEQVMPAGYAEQASYNAGASQNALANDGRAIANQAIYQQETNASGMPTASGVVPAQCYDEGQYGGGGYEGGDGGCYGAGYDGNMPMGMPTSGFAPPAMPPNYLAGAPTWGMPITGTPIGLPGPPHVPLGTPASLQKHVMKNRTRIHMPPPVTSMKVSVKHRPGLNYPKPVTHVYVDEAQREPFRLLPSWLPGFFHHAGDSGPGFGGGGAGSHGAAECQ